MNMKIFKKGFAKACQKVRDISAKNTVSPSSSSSSISKSSGYGTSLSSDNIFLDEKRFRLASNLFSSQIKFKNHLRHELELYVRPMAAFLSEQDFLVIFQNVEKISSISEFMLNMVNVNDFYESIISAMCECVVLLSDAYTTYVNGFGKSMQLLQEINIDLSECFDVRKFLTLPIRNCKKIYQILTRLEKLECSRARGLRKEFKVVCEKLAEIEVKVEIVPNQSVLKSKKLVTKSKKLLVKKKKCQANNLPSDFTDYEGNRHYFL